MRRREKTVAAPGWNVSVVTGSNIAGAVLNVFRLLKGKFAYGNHNGRAFPNREAAWAFALERGYSQPYRVPFCRWCRERHTFLRGRSGWCPRHNQFVFNQEVA